MSNYVDAEHIREMLFENKIACLTSADSKAAELHLERCFPLRFATSIVDWDRVPSTMLKWTDATDDEAVAWATGTLAGQCSWGLLLFRSDEPCLIGPFDVMIRHMDKLVWKAPGCRILFGVERNNLGDIVFTQGIVEFNGKGELFAAVEI